MSYIYASLSFNDMKAAELRLEEMKKSLKVTIPNIILYIEIYLTSALLFFQTYLGSTHTQTKQHDDLPFII